MSAHRILLLMVGIVVVALAACSASSSGVSAGERPQYNLQPTDDGVAFDAAGVTAAAEANKASRRQIGYLEDGLLTFAEYEAAIQTAIACAQDIGVDVVELGVRQHRHGYPLVDYAVPTGSNGLSEKETLARFDSCYDEHAGSVDAYWQLGHDPDTQPGEFDASLEVLGRCLNENGVPTAPGAITPDNLPEALDAVDRILGDGGPNCMIEAGL